MTNHTNDTAAVASLGDFADREARVDEMTRSLLRRVLPRERSAQVAFDYLAGLTAGVRANCWSLAEAAGHDGPHRMQGLLRSYRWDWRRLRDELPALAAAVLPDDPDDLIGPGLAIDETAHLRHGDATSCVAPQHAGCTGKVENCVTWVFSAYVTAHGQAWVWFDVYLPARWAGDEARRKAAGIPEDLAFSTKPRLAIDHLDQLTPHPELKIRWVAFDEVYGRSEDLRRAAARKNLAYVGIIPCTYEVTLPSGTVIKAEEAVARAVFERRSCGDGSKGPRYSDWAMLATSIDGQYLLIRRLIGRERNNLTFYLSWAPPGTAATMRYFITIAGRRWPVEETNKTGKDVLGWDTSQVRTHTGICRHTALSALAQLRAAALRAAATGILTPPATTSSAQRRAAHPPAGHQLTDAQIRSLLENIPLGDAPVPVHAGLPCPPGLAPIGLSIPETLRLTSLAQRLTTGAITAAEAAFALWWSLRRRRHQAIARWHHYSARLALVAGTS